MVHLKSSLYFRNDIFDTVKTYDQFIRSTLLCFQSSFSSPPTVTNETAAAATAIASAAATDRGSQNGIESESLDLANQLQVKRLSDQLQVKRLADQLQVKRFADNFEDVSTCQTSTRATSAASIHGCRPQPREVFAENDCPAIDSQQVMK